MTGTSLSKVCTKCGALKLLEEFNRAKYRRDGRRSECKACKLLQTNAWRERNNPHVNALARERSKLPNYRRNVRDRVRRWKDRHPEAKKAEGTRYNLNFKLAEKDLTSEQWQKIRAFYGHTCAYCGQSKPLVKSHVIPLSDNGDHVAANIVPACIVCASGRHDGSLQPRVMHPVQAGSHQPAGAEKRA